MLTAHADRYLVPDLYDVDTYFRVDTRTGVMNTASGARCLTLSTEFLRGLWTSLSDECGPAAGFVLKRCGQMWGRRFAKRFVSEVGTFYQRPLEELPMLKFNLLLERFLATHGWGRLTLDYSLIHRGLITAECTDTIFASVVGSHNEPVDHLLAGVLSAIFSETSGRDLDCHETQCLAMGAPCCTFVVGLSARVADVPDWVKAGQNHDAVLGRLAG